MAVLLDLLFTKNKLYYAYSIIVAYSWFAVIS